MVAKFSRLPLPGVQHQHSFFTDGYSCSLARGEDGHDVTVVDLPVRRYPACRPRGGNVVSAGKPSLIVTVFSNRQLDQQLKGDFDLKVLRTPVRAPNGELLL